MVQFIPVLIVAVISVLIIAAMTMVQFIPVLIVAFLHVLLGLLSLGAGHPFLRTSSFGHYLMSSASPAVFSFSPIPLSLQFFIIVILMIGAALITYRSARTNRNIA